MIVTPCQEKVQRNPDSGSEANIQFYSIGDQKNNLVNVNNQGLEPQSLACTKTRFILKNTRSLIDEREILLS